MHMFVVWFLDDFSTKIKVLQSHPQLFVALGSTLIIGGCAYPVFKKDQRPGHDLFSSEKPESIREAQEAQREEYRRLIKEQRKQLAAEQEEIRRKLQQQQQQ